MCSFECRVVRNHGKTCVVLKPVLTEKSGKCCEDVISNFYVLKGMVHMITMLTYIAQIDIGEYKNPFKCPEITMVNLFWLLYVP